MCKNSCHYTFDDNWKLQQLAPTQFDYTDEECESGAPQHAAAPTTCHKESLKSLFIFIKHSISKSMRNSMTLV